MENIQIRRNIMRDAHLVICAAIFADGTKPPVSVVDYIQERSDDYYKISTSRHVFLKIKDRTFSMVEKSIVVDGVKYVYKDTLTKSVQENVALFVIPQNDPSMRFTIQSGTQVYNRIDDMFKEVFHG